MAKNDQKIVITGQMVATVVSVISVIASTLLIFDNDKNASGLFLLFSLLWLSFNLLNSRKKGAK